ncbi:MFS transporter [Pedobacter hartonius]|uniref:Predicted arabinose efflux permease, MFS family n=1 Tax=Pedobacter hartonius TaxID=425514 RepID=A0A1H4B9I3_9SPHI|nr:MFS transporter [Pedobacter hartonius]SEA44800.1 Predicted arabinose efflux permease, MFS family [Pedobacter hartonius]
MKNKIAYIGCISLIGVISTEFGVIGILPQIAGYYHITIDKAGVLLSAFAMVAAIAGPFLTILTSGINRKKLMAISMTIFLITGVVSSLSPPFWLLLLVRLLPAFLHPALVSAAVGAATVAADKKDAHKMMAIVIGGVGIATITTVPFATYIASVFNSWQASFMVQTVISSIAISAIWLGLPSMPVEEEKSYSTQLKILTKPLFIASATFTFLMNGTMFTTYSYFADYLGKINGMDPKTISAMLLLFGITGVLGNFAAGKMLSKNITITTASFLIGLTLISIPIYYSGSMSPWVIVLIAIWGFFHTPCFLTGQAYMIETAPEAPEFANSISISFGNLGISLGTAISGLSIAGNGLHSAPWVMLSFGILALITLSIKEIMEKKFRAKQKAVNQY